MKRIDFNEGWTCRCITRVEAEYPVTLPHDAMLGEARSEESRGEGNTGWYMGADYEYRKKFVIPKDEEGSDFLIEFESVYHNAEVYINGTKAAERPYGYTNFYVDAKELIKYGAENEIRVVAHNSDQPNSRWYSGAGIYRPVFLWTGKGAYVKVNGVKIHTISCRPAVIEVAAAVSCCGMGKIEICDGKNVIASRQIEVRSEDRKGRYRTKTEITVPDAQLWSCESPKLYTCRVVYGEDVVEETFGIRLLKWNETDGFTINGKRTILRGACIHHDNGILGACAYPEAEERRVRILKENGYNALRSAHNPCSKALLHACDRLGMLMVDEYVDVWYIHKTEYDYVDHLEKWWKQDLKDMVEKDYNHPCVIMYSTGNEVSETAQKKGIELTGTFTNYLHKLDGTRPVTCGINIFFNFLSSVGLGVYSDDKAKKHAEAAEKAAQAAQKGKAGGNAERKKPVGSAFYNTLACMIGDYFMKCGATLYPCDVKTRDAFANMDIAGYNYGIFRYKHDLKKYPKRLILGSETFCKDAYSFWETAKKHKRIIGDFVWAGMDYIGETGDGAAEYRDYKEDNPACRMTGNNGRIDLLGRPRAEAAFTKVAFEQSIGPYIAVEPVYQKEKLHLTGWALTKAMESWSYAGCGGQPAKVEVYARAASVELFINGKSVGKKQMKNKCRVMFSVIYEDGEITAVSYDNNGAELGRKTLKTAGTETMLRICPEEASIKPKGLGFIWLRYTDREGMIKPMEKHLLKVEVENGKLVGLGSANSYVKGNYTDHTVKTYYGEALAVVRADGSGAVKVTVASREQKKSVEIPLWNADQCDGHA